MLLITSSWMRPDRMVISLGDWFFIRAFCLRMLEDKNKDDRQKLCYPNNIANIRELIKHVLLALLGFWHYMVLLARSTCQVTVIPIFWGKKTKPKQHSKKTPNLLWWRNTRRKTAPNKLPSLGMLLVSNSWQNKETSATKFRWEKAYTIETLM